MPKITLERRFSSVFNGVPQCAGPRRVGCGKRGKRSLQHADRELAGGALEQDEGEGVAQLLEPGLERAELHQHLEHALLGLGLVPDELRPAEEADVAVGGVDRELRRAGAEHEVVVGLVAVGERAGDHPLELRRVLWGARGRVQTSVVGVGMQVGAATTRGQ